MWREQEIRPTDVTQQQLELASKRIDAAAALVSVEQEENVSSELAQGGGSQPHGQLSPRQQAASGSFAH
ncbi:hypothetical protein GN956_G21882 [Arapaima gigas]